MQKKEYILKQLDLETRYVERQIQYNMKIIKVFEVKNPKSDAKNILKYLGRIKPANKTGIFFELNISISRFLGNKL